MGEMRKLTTVAVDNSMTREMAVQYAVWTWYQSDPGEKARDLCRAGAEIVLPRFIENEESALGDAHRAWKRSLFASDKPDSSTEVADKPIGGFSLQSDYIENYAPLEMLAMSLDSVPAPSKADYWDYKKVLREAILADTVNSARWEDKNATKILSSEEHIDQFTVGELMSLPSCCVTAQNSTLLAKHVGKKLLEERDIDKLFPEAAKLWKSAHSDAENIRASVRRGKTLLELLLLALILLAGGFAANYFDAAQTAFVILVTGVVLLALCLGGGIAAFATAAVLLVLNTVYPYAQYAPNALYVLARWGHWSALLHFCLYLQKKKRPSWLRKSNQRCCSCAASTVCTVPLSCGICTKSMRRTPRSWTPTKKCCKTCSSACLSWK